MLLVFVVLGSSVFAMYDTHTGRFLQQDPLGITPNPQQPNRFEIPSQYTDGMNLYEYVRSNPIIYEDPKGLVCPTGFLDPLPSEGSNGDFGWKSAYSRYLIGFGTNKEFKHTSVFARRVAEEGGVNRSLKPLKNRIRDEAKTIAKDLQPSRCTTLVFGGVSPEGYLFGGDEDWVGTLHQGNNDEYSKLYHTVRCCVYRRCSSVQVKCRIRFDLHDKYTFDSIKSRWFNNVGINYWIIVHFDKLMDEKIGL